MGEPMRLVEGGGFTLLTNDFVVIAVVRRCAELEAALREAHYQEVSRYRTLRRDASQIKKKVCHP